MSFSSKNKKFWISSDGAIQDVCPNQGGGAETIA